jgi:hypothetical protein
MAEATETTEQKNKKINKMNLDEVNAAIKKTEEHMAGTNSAYAQALLARKRDLEQAG